MRWFLLILLLVISSNLFAQTTINIPADFKTIQSGLDAASPGDTISVEPGVYVENLLWPSISDLKLISKGGFTNTIIDGNFNGSTIVMSMIDNSIIDTNTTISGFSIINGGNVNLGGGITCINASPTLEGNKFFNNSADERGGGCYFEYSNAILRDNIITQCEITNVKQYPSYPGGAGIYSTYSSLNINKIIINNNEVKAYNGGGGGINIIRDGFTILKNASIYGNVSPGGGGIQIAYQGAHFENVEIFENIATGAGGQAGGLEVHGCKVFCDNVVIYKNQGSPGGVYLFTGELINAKIIHNKSSSYGGVYATNSSIMDGLFVAYNTGDNYSAMHLSKGSGGGTVIKNSTIFENGLANNDNGAIFSTAGVSLNNCNIVNHGVGLISENSVVVDAEMNFWGHQSGPFNTKRNPNGLGDSVTQFISITPWLLKASSSAPLIPVKKAGILSTSDSEIKLNWDSSQIENLTGYKVYYDNEKKFTNFNYSIDVGLDTVCTLKNLEIGQTYYISVTCYDTDGNESSYSQAVSANTTPAPIISINNSTIDYGSVTIEKEVSFNVEITNNGTDVLTIFSSHTATDEFYTNQTTDLNISPNESAQLSVYFKPLVIGEFQDELTITSNANNEPQITIQLHGSGVLPEAPTILSIADVHNDQGGNVRIEFKKSRYDQNGDTISSIASYSIWRFNTNSEWDAIGMFNADRSEKYNFVSTTLGDSTVNGIVWSVFKVSAHSVNPDDFYYSDPDSGYSIDNIAPTVPQGLNALGFEDRVEITWKNNKEQDFQYYAIYRSTDSEFNPDTMQTDTVTTIDSSYIDTDVNYGIMYFYRISAFDYAGNQSDYTESVSAFVTGVGNETLLPKEYVLHQNYPNPFNPTTMIKYGLPEQSNVKVEIFNTLGQRVGVLVNGQVSAGNHESIWNAESLPSGIYLVSIRAEGLSSRKNFTQVKKALLLK